MHHSYIVRVYRHEKNNPRMLVGTVEKVGEKGKNAFTNVDELWAIMNSGKWGRMEADGTSKTRRGPKGAGEEEQQHAK